LCGESFWRYRIARVMTLLANLGGGLTKKIPVMSPHAADQIGIFGRHYCLRSRNLNTEPKLNEHNKCEIPFTSLLPCFPMDVVPSSVLAENECPDAMEIGPINDWPHETRLEFRFSFTTVLSKALVTKRNRFLTRTSGYSFPPSTKEHDVALALRQWRMLPTQLVEPTNIFECGISPGSRSPRGMGVQQSLLHSRRA
jgi:hypothetical protein